MPKHLWGLYVYIIYAQTFHHILCGLCVAIIYAKTFYKILLQIFLIDDP